MVTAKVLTKTLHPDSDHMYVCSVDVGDKNLDADGNPAPLQIVCGAQNFEAGDHIVTAMIGAVLPGDVKIKKSKLRGVVSMGMNCSARELGLGGDHSGIMILPEDTPCGMPFAEYVGSSDTVLDCEITPNRPDCLSMIGMARETGAIFDRDFHVELPAIKAETGRATDDELSVEIADEGLCDRYVARIVRNVKVGPSPDWMVKRLNALGVRPHNNIVDITNYVMMLSRCTPLTCLPLPSAMVIAAWWFAPPSRTRSSRPLTARSARSTPAWALSPTASVPWRWPALWAAWIPRSRTTPST